ncbi:MAG TPA: helix-hairpin-helix domain-containing protein [Chitinophaga sp.]
MKKRLLKDQLGFTKQEQTGILVLLALIAITLCIPRLRESLIPASMPMDSSFQAEVSAFQQQLAAADTVKVRNKSYTHYREKKPWPKRPGSFHKDTFPARFPVRKPFVVFINSADSSSWEALPGIGPTLAARLVRFREKLGGFYSIVQVAETYGLPDSTFKKIQAFLRLDSSSLKKLNINQMDEKSLGQHPYIRYKLARLIVQYRSNHGPFSRPEDLYNIPLVDDSIYRKLEKYISL